MYIHTHTPDGMRIYIYTCVYTYIYTHTYIHTHLHFYVYIYVYTHTHTWWHESTQSSEVSAVDTDCRSTELPGAAWFISHLNESCHIWMNHLKKSHHIWVSLGIVCSRYGLSQHTIAGCCVIHITFEWVTSHLNDSCHIWMSHVTFEWVMSHLSVVSCLRESQSCHVWERCDSKRQARVCVCSTQTHTHTHTYTHCQSLGAECVMSRMNESNEWVVSHLNGSVTGVISNLNEVLKIVLNNLFKCDVIFEWVVSGLSESR